MDALTLLTTRASQSLLTDPAPDAAALSTLFNVAARAPDHGRLRPWRFLCVRGESRAELGELFLRGLLARDPQASTEKQEKLRKAPLRAPLLIVAIARLQQHPKVPVIEQQLSAGCAVHGLLLAAQALGFGAIWRTGDPTDDPVVAQGLGLQAQEQIIGFIYVGTPAATKPAPAIELTGMVANWPT